MLVSVKSNDGEEFARNKIEKVMFFSGTGGTQGHDNLYSNEEIDELGAAIAIINLDNVVAVGLAPDITEEEYQKLKAFEDELDLKLNAYEVVQ
jgi:hypothetical protein